MLNRMQIRRRQHISLIDESITICLRESDVGPFEVLNVCRVLELCLKSKVTPKVYFKQTVAIAIMKVYFRWTKCDKAPAPDARSKLQTSRRRDQPSVTDLSISLIQARSRQTVTE